MRVIRSFESEADVDLLPDGEQGGKAFTFDYIFYTGGVALCAPYACVNPPAAPLGPETL
jgi:hypothetical protein